VSKKTRNEVKKRIEKIIPPPLDKCNDLADCGSLVIPLLEYKKEYNDEEQYSCLRTLQLIGKNNIVLTVLTYFTDSMPSIVVDILGDILCSFKGSVMEEYDIQNKLSNRLLKSLDENTLYINGWIFRYPQLVDISRVNSLQSITSLVINNYLGFDNNYLSFFANVRNLTIKGEFDNLDILKSFKNINSLNIYNITQYNIKELNDYFNNLTKVTKLGLFIKYPENTKIGYIEAIENIESLEMDLSQFNNLIDTIFCCQKLKRLDIHCENQEGYDLSILKSHSTLKTLCLYFDSNSISLNSFSLSKLYNLDKIILINQIQEVSYIGLNEIEYDIPDCSIEMC
jgi:hypothetical protein